MGKSKDMYYSLKERGLCVRCCKSKQADGHVACKSCRDKVKSYNKKVAELYKAETKLKVEIKKLYRGGIRRFRFGSLQDHR